MIKRLIIYLILSFVTLASLGAYGAIQDGRYNLVNGLSAKAMDVEARSSADGANVIQWTLGSGTNQQ
jgi:hypothetical protein